MLDRLPFKHVVAVDFEFEFGGHDTLEAAGRSGERPRPVCMVAKELRSGKTWRLWRGQFGSQPPFPIDAEHGAGRLLRQRRARLLQGAELAAAGFHPRPVHRISRPHQRLQPAERRRPARRCDVFRDRRNRHHREAGSARPHPVRWAVVGGRSRRHYSNTAKATCWRWSGCCSPCCRASTCRMHCCAAAS